MHKTAGMSCNVCRERRKVLINESICTDCSLCVTVCPVRRSRGSIGMFSSIVVAGVGGQGTLLASRSFLKLPREGTLRPYFRDDRDGTEGRSVSSHQDRISGCVACDPTSYADVLMIRTCRGCKTAQQAEARASAVVNVDCIIPTNVASVRVSITVMNTSVRSKITSAGDFTSCSYGKAGDARRSISSCSAFCRSWDTAFWRR